MELSRSSEIVFIGKLVKWIDGDEKMLLGGDNSRCSYNQKGAGLNITNFPPEPADPPNVRTMSLAGARSCCPVQPRHNST